MNVSLYQAAAGMNANMRWQEAISENLGSGSVTGFRKQLVSFSAIEAGQATAGARHVIPSAHSAISFQQGEIRPSQGLLDFALEGPGFFEVQLPDGTLSYTRDGEFKLNAQGQLVTKQGYLVMGNGGPMQFDPSNPSPITVSANGQVSHGEEVKGRMRVVEFDRVRDLTSIGGGYFLAEKPGALPADAEVSSVRQGYLEQTNMSPMVEMANLLTSMRMFEANQRVLQNQDERLGRVISELGHPA